MLYHKPGTGFVLGPYDFLNHLQCEYVDEKFELHYVLEKITKAGIWVLYRQDNSGEFKKCPISEYGWE